VVVDPPSVWGEEVIPVGSEESEAAEAEELGDWVTIGVAVGRDPKEETVEAGDALLSELVAWISAFNNVAVVPNTTWAVFELADPMSVAEVEIVSLATEVGDKSSPMEVTAAEVGEDWSPAVVAAAEAGKDSSSTTVVAAAAAEVIVSEELDPQDP